MNQAARADVKLHSLFTDNMVLQRDKTVPVWGTAAAGEKVTVQVMRAVANTDVEQQVRAVADANGKWQTRLKPMKAATGLSLNVLGNNDMQTLHNVAVGDVYICSGQSNMQWALRDSNNAQAEIAAANFPNIRLFTVSNTLKAAPLDEVAIPTNWQVCNPQTAAAFSAVGYFFGRELNQKLGVPIGLINSSWGGTIAEAWTSRETLAAMPEYKASLASMDENARTDVPMDERMAKWWSENDPGSKANMWAHPAWNDAPWKEMTLPQQWETGGLPNFDGIVWFRRVVEIPEALAGKPLTLRLGAIDDRDTTFWNGVEIGSTDGWQTPRNYLIPAESVKAGRNVIAVRVFDGAGGGGIYGGALPGGGRMRLDKDGADTIFLDGAWKYQVSRAANELTPAPGDFNSNPNQPTVLYNGMIAPLVPFGVRGAIWYQGESNADKPEAYRTLFPALIRDWRQKFGQDFGFYFVQLANFLPRVDTPNQSGWAELRDAQTSALALPKTGMATIIDAGAAGDIHPRDKQTVGKRLALSALANEYGQKIGFAGPTLRAMKIEGDKIRVLFSHAQGLKTLDGAAPKGFIIAGADGKFAWATAKIEGESIVLSSDEVKTPTTVRYAWANNPEVNLYNAAGLPAVPFRSDAVK